MSAAHLPARRLHQLACGRPATAAEAAHAARCRTCRGEIDVERALRVHVMTAPAGPCPDSLLLVRWAEGDPLSVGEGRTLRAHAAACGQCAGDLAALESTAARLAPTAAVARPSSGAAGLRRRLQALLAWSMPASLALAARGQKVPLPGFQAAMKTYRRGRFAAARELLVQARRSGEDAPELDFYLGCCWLEAGRARRSVACLADAVRRCPRLGEYHYHLANALLAAGELATAVSALERVAALPGPHRKEAQDALRAAGARARASSRH